MRRAVMLPRRYRRFLGRAARVGALLLVLLLSGWGLVRLGQAVTPTPPPGARPVWYTPAVRRTAAYRRQAVAWMAAWTALDGELVAVLHLDGEVYAQARAAQRLLERLERLDQEVLLTYPPAALVSLRDEVQVVSGQYLLAAVALNRWVGAPTEAHYWEMLEQIRLARWVHAAVAANAWLQLEQAAPAPLASPLRPPEALPVEEVPDGWAD